MGVQFHGSQSLELTGLDGFLYPVCELAEVGVDTWHVGLVTQGLSKGHKALQGPVADRGPPESPCCGETENENPKHREMEIDVRSERNQMRRSNGRRGGKKDSNVFLKRSILEP